MTEDFELSGIAHGTIVTLVGYHLARAVAPANLKDDGALIAVGRPGVHSEEVADDAEVDPDAHRHRKE